VTSGHAAWKIFAQSGTLLLLLTALAVQTAQAEKSGLISQDRTFQLGMELDVSSATVGRYKVVTEKKASGATYTPKILADFVARQMVSTADFSKTDHPLRILDPALGDGELLLRLLERLEAIGVRNVDAYGFDTDPNALQQAKDRITARFPYASLTVERRDFLSYVSETCEEGIAECLFRPSQANLFDLVIANPPYVRTQVMGAEQARLLAREFGLTGRVDLYHAFVVGIAAVLKPLGIAGVITSNRFMTTKAGASVRRALLNHATLKHVWDLGDSKVFEAAVLPAVLVVEGRNGKRSEHTLFTSLYETQVAPGATALDPIDALQYQGVVAVPDGRRFEVRHGVLNPTRVPDAIWTIKTASSDAWLETVAAHTWGTFSSIGKVRVGIKTTADKIFIRSDWGKSAPDARPELLRPLVTHHMARRFRALDAAPHFEVLYPHFSRGGRRYAAELAEYPKARQYLEQHRKLLEGRSYVTQAGRAWYEIWVPQDPGAWSAPKLVFRDISHQPMFWLNFDGSVVNGDCYWLACNRGVDCDLLWLAAAVANSRFIETFYDHKFNNKLYAGRRRFITQYVEQFPLPDPHTRIAKTIVQISKQIYEQIDSASSAFLEEQLNELVLSAFGLAIEKIYR